MQYVECQWFYFKCKHCSRIFSTPRFYIKPEEKSQEGFETLKCPYCENLINTKEDFLLNEISPVRVEMTLQYNLLVP